MEMMRLLSCDERGTPLEITLKRCYGDRVDTEHFMREGDTSWERSQSTARVTKWLWSSYLGERGKTLI